MTGDEGIAGRVVPGGVFQDLADGNCKLCPLRSCSTRPAWFSVVKGRRFPPQSGAGLRYPNGRVAPSRLSGVSHGLDGAT